MKCSEEFLIIVIVAYDLNFRAFTTNYNETFITLQILIFLLVYLKRY